MIESLKTGKKTVGIKQTLKTVMNDEAKCVYIANDADVKVISGLKQVCQEKNVKIEYAENMKILGKACGIEVGAAVACLKKE